MTVAEIITRLIGVPGDVELEIVDLDGSAVTFDAIEIQQSHHGTYATAKVDERFEKAT